MCELCIIYFSLTISFTILMFCVMKLMIMHIISICVAYDFKWDHMSVWMIIMNVMMKLLFNQNWCICETYADWMYSYSRLIWKDLITHLTAVHVNVITVICQHVLRIWLTCFYTRVLTDDKALKEFRAAVYVQHMCVRCNMLLTVIICDYHIESYIWSAYALHLIYRIKIISWASSEIAVYWSASVFSIHIIYVQFNSCAEIQFVLLFWTESCLLLACIMHMHHECLSWW